MLRGILKIMYILRSDFSRPIFINRHFRKKTDYSIIQVKSVVSLSAVEKLIISRIGHMYHPAMC